MARIFRYSSHANLPETRFEREKKKKMMKKKH